jgi:hypothetical protein
MMEKIDLLLLFNNNKPMKSLKQIAHNYLVNAFEYGKIDTIDFCTGIESSQEEIEAQIEEEIPFQVDPEDIALHDLTEEEFISKVVALALEEFRSCLRRVYILP